MGSGRGPVLRHGHATGGIRPRARRGLSSAATGMFGEHLGEGPGERVGVARPAGGDVRAVPHDPGGPGIGRRVPGPPARLAPVVGDAGLDIDEVALVCQGAGDLLLHRHVAGGLSRLLHVGAVVVGVPKASPAGELPCPALQLPRQRRGAAAVEHRMPGGGFCGTRRHEHAVADRPDGPARSERVHGHLLHLGALEVVPHPTGPVAPGQHRARRSRCAVPRPSAAAIGTPHPPAAPSRRDGPLRRRAGCGP